MSLVQGYSSDEDAGDITQDVFGISAVSSSKKPRVEEPSASSLVPSSAPHVLAEVSPISCTFDAHDPSSYVIYCRTP
jgi:hypothetical protein